MLKHGDHVGRFRAVDQGANGTEDQLVLMAVKVIVHQQIVDPVPRLVVQQKPTQNAGLGLNGMGGHTQLRDLAIGCDVQGGV